MDATKNQPGIRLPEFARLALLLSAAGLLLLAGCAQLPVTYTPEPAQDPIPQSPALPLPSPTPDQVPITPPFNVWLDPAFPDSIQAILSPLPDFTVVASPQEAAIKINPAGTGQVGLWTYLLVAPFYSSLEDLPLADLRQLWDSGDIKNSDYNRLHLSQDTLSFLSYYWSDPKPGATYPTPPRDIADEIWENPSSLAIIPFEQLSPSYKVISIDGINPLHRSGMVSAYPLSFPIFAEIMDPGLLSDPNLPELSNLNPDQLTSVALTGVTALVRDTAAIMEEKGVLYPGDNIRDILLSADLTHINNEVPFAVDCPPPDSNQQSLYFCSSDSYLELLESIGTDIMELSGDHFADQGPEAMIHSLELYQQAGFLTYGGGENLQAGLEPLLIEHNGNRFAFIGCNAKAHEKYATATETNPGASPCDFEWMLPEVSRLAEEGYLVIATMQHEEVDDFFPVALQLFDFRNLSDAGAVIVSGSQAHHPQGFELTDSSFIHYGLGNLFFDQWYLARYNPEEHLNKDKSLIDIHYFYNGSYINTQIIQLQFIDNAQPRLMTPDEKEAFLDDFYQASKYNGRWIYLYPSGFFTDTESQ